jgi:glutamyl-tRNA synthetase
MAVANVEAVLALLEDAASKGPLTTDTVWDAVRDVVKEHKLKARSEVMLQLRHALTGQKVCPGNQQPMSARLTVQKGPSVPEVVVVLGIERSFARIRAGLEYVKQRQA